MPGVAGVVELWGGVLLELVAREEAGVEVLREAGVVEQEGGE